MRKNYLNQKALYVFLFLFTSSLVFSKPNLYMSVFGKVTRLDKMQNVIGAEIRLFPYKNVNGDEYKEIDEIEDADIDDVDVSLVFNSKTDTKGKFLIDNVPEGTYAISFKISGLWSNIYTDDESIENQIIHVNAGKNVILDINIDTTDKYKTFPKILKKIENLRTTLTYLYDKKTIDEWDQSLIKKN